MSKLFPSIPLVAEEDSAFLQSNNLVGAVVDVVTDKATSGDQLTQDDIVRAIDRGGKDAYVFGPKLATYWVSYVLKFHVHGASELSLCSSF